MMTLEGRTCVFAGATGGDGVAAAIELCRGGMNIVMMTHQMEQAVALMNRINDMQLAGKCHVVQDGACQTPPKTEEQIYEEIYREFGSIDVIICNIGDDGAQDSIETVHTQALLESINHLVGGSYSMLKSSLPYLKKSSAARVIFMTTVEGVRGGVRESFSNAVAKGAVLALTKNCAARLAAQGIAVNCIAKGAIQRQKEKAAAPIGRPGTPEDLAQAICYLACEEISYVTGTVLDVSGGMNLM